MGLVNAAHIPQTETLRAKFDLSVHVYIEPYLAQVWLRTQPSSG